MATPSPWLAFAVLVVAAVAPAAVEASDFTDCLCWDVTTDKWCGNAANTSDNEFYRDACSDWVTDSLAWTAPAAVLFVCFFFFPLVFCVARCCFNCCGGRQPSDGLCCPDRYIAVDPATGEQIPQNEPKTYSNRAIFVTKALFWLCFGSWIYFSVGVYHINDQVHTALLTTMDRTQHTIDALHSDVGDIVSQLALVTLRGGADLVPSALFAPMTSAEHRLAELTYHTRLVVGNITKYENDAGKGFSRAQIAYGTPSYALVVLVVAVFFVLCNCSNVSVLVLAGLFSLVAALTVLVFMLHAVVAQAATALCDGYNDTVIPLLVDIATSKGGCGVDSVMKAFDAAGQVYVTHACQNGSAALNASLYGAMQGLCSTALLFMGCPATVPSLCETRFNFPALATAVMTVYDTATATAASGCAGCNISTCAAAGGCTNSEAKALAAQFAAFATAFGQPMSYVFGTSYPDYANCSALEEAIASGGPLQYALCKSFSKDFSNIAILFLELSLLSIPVILVLVLGGKRFRRMQSLTQPGEDLHVETVTDFVNSVLLPTAADKAMFGEPILSPSQTKRLADANASQPLLRETSSSEISMRRHEFDDGEKTIQGP